MRFYKLEDSLLVNLLGETTSLKEVTANTEEASKEKHIPVIEADGDKIKVQVGSILHPMVDVHFIELIAIQTEKGIQIKYLNPGELPIAEFVLTDDKLICAYAYCNLHGLWRSK